MILEAELRQIMLTEGCLWRGRWLLPATVVAVESELDVWRAGALVAAGMAKPAAVPEVDGEDGCS
jgi:hypothetical protein